MSNILVGSKALIIYKKEDLYKVLWMEDAIMQSNKLKEDGYKHVETVNPQIYLEHLLNQKS